MALRAVNTPPPVRSAEREALALAIGKLRSERADRAALNSAIVAADAAVRRCSGAVEDARAAVEESQRAQADYLVLVAQGVGADAPPATRVARDRLQDAEDDLTAARAAVDALRERQQAPDHTDVNRMLVREAAAKVLASEFQTRADALVVSATASLMQVVEVAEFVRRLSDARLFGGSRNSINQLVGAPGVLVRLSDLDVPGGDAARSKGAERFAALFDGLLGDADAVLPG